MFNFNHVPEPNLVDFLKDVALDRRGVFTMCSSTSDARCNDYMQVTLTNEGICYSFNMISQAEMFHPDVLQDEYQYLEPWDTDGATVERGELLKVAGSGLDASIGFNLIHYPLKIDTSCVVSNGETILGSFISTKCRKCMSLFFGTAWPWLPGTYTRAHRLSGPF